MDIESNFIDPVSNEYSLIRVNLSDLGIIEYDEKFTKITGYGAEDIENGLTAADIIINNEALNGENVWETVNRRRLMSKRYKIRRKDGSISAVNCSFFADGETESARIVITDMSENESDMIWAKISRQMMCAVNIYDGISTGLEIIGRHLGLDRATFVEFDPKLTKITRSLQWSAHGIPKTIDIVYDINLMEVKNLGYTGSYVMYNIGECYPKELSELFQGFGVSSILGYAVHDKENLYGYIFIASIEKRTWSVGQYEILQTISDVITSGIRKNRTEEMLWLSRENDRKILSCITSAIVVTDRDTHEILYKNNTARMTFPKLNLGDKCYRALCGRETQCVICPSSGSAGEYTIRNGKYRVNISEMIWENSRPARILQIIPAGALSDEMIEKKYSFIYSEPCDVYYEIEPAKGSCKTVMINEKSAFPLGEITGNPRLGLESFLQQFVDEKNSAELRECIAHRTLDQKRTQVHELEVMNPNGGKLWFLFRAAKLVDENNTVLIIAAKNITEKKRVEQYERQRSEIVNNSVIRVHPFVLTVNLTKGTYCIYQNKSKRIPIENSGLYEDFHRFFCERIHPDERESYSRIMDADNLLKCFEKHGNELTFFGRCLEEDDGEYHFLSMLAARLEDDGSGDVSAVMMGRYVDAERYREKTLRESLAESEAANRSRNAFLSRMSHDMRTPLNSIINMTGLAGKNIKIPVLAEECLEKVELSSKYLLSLVNNVLELGRYENGKIILSRDVINVERFINDIRIMMEPDAQLKNHTFTVHSNGITNASVYCDETRLRQIIVNLITNAIKFTPEGGKIDFTVNETSSSENSAFVVFRITDNGIGMSKEFQKRLFIPFEQEHVGNRTYGGSGLGLSICRMLVEAMGGVISVYSRRGQGTEFEVRLSFERCEPIELNEEEPDVPLNLMCNHILLVEDDKINAEIAEMLLGAENVQSEIAFNGKMAIEKFAASEVNYYDAILMDIQMPVMDGLEATKVIRAMKRPDAATIPIIAMTANVYISDIEEAKAYGMTYHIQKPVVPRLLYEALQKCCNKN